MCVKLEEKTQPYQYNILVDDNKIGEMYCERCRITDIEIERSHRGEGYGKEAVKKWVEMRESDCDRLDTTPIMSDAMEQILKDLDFKKEEVDRMDGQYRYVLET